ncbi:MAG: type II toxin-antitoxin system PemK/MazF family toxin [Proteobacteria bacterium]|nr:type II toxin-antitoxin system PemK/MazF family toxin [Pseudomonadota bacterium]
MVAKDYESWFPIKEKLDVRAKDKLPSFKKRQVWWAHIGVNVGYEIFGKGSGFLRPVLIIKKYSNFTFLGAPLSTTKPKRKNNVPIEFMGKQGIVCLDQLRTFDIRRLSDLYGRLPRQEFEEVMATLRGEF